MVAEDETVSILKWNRSFENDISETSWGAIEGRLAYP